jgi:choline dehydrogenase-like flavoprotein
VKRIVIVGGGFGGLYAAQALSRADADVTLVDRRNHHLFSPLLYQVATAGLSAPDIATPIRSILRRQRNTTIRLADVTAIDPVARVVTTDHGPLAYDVLILAPGSREAYFGHNEWAAYAPGLKDIEDAFEIRRRVLIAFENAEQEADEARRRAWLTFAIVAGRRRRARGRSLRSRRGRWRRTSATSTRRARRADRRAPRVLATFSSTCRSWRTRPGQARVEILLERRVPASTRRASRWGTRASSAHRAVGGRRGVVAARAQLGAPRIVRAACWSRPT